MDKQTIELEDLEIQQEIGQGRSSVIKKAKHKSCPKEYAVKIFTEADYAESEFQIYSMLSECPFIINTYGIEDSCIIMDYYKNSDLFDYLDRSDRSFPEDLGKFYFRQIAEGVKHLHKMQICHRDLKIENVLLDDDYNIKIIDFGFSVKLDDQKQRLNRTLGTHGYMAPEVENHTPYDGKKNDIFALGVILFSIVQGFPPIYESARVSDPYYKFFCQDREAVFWKALKAKFAENVFSDDFIELVGSMLSYDPERRPSIEQILEHPYLSGVEETVTDKYRIEYMESLKTQGAQEAQEAL